MAIFRAKFACNLAISNLVFRWESCKGSVWESMKKYSSLCKIAEIRDCNSWLASHQMMHMSEACKEDEQSRQLEHYRTKSPVWQFYLLVAWTRDSIKSWGQVASRLCFEKKKTWLFAFHSYSNINIPYTHEMLRASRENIERKNPQKNKIDSSTIFT